MLASTPFPSTPLTSTPRPSTPVYSPSTARPSSCPLHTLQETSQKSFKSDFPRAWQPAGVSARSTAATFPPRHHPPQSLPMIATLMLLRLQKTKGDRTRQQHSARAPRSSAWLIAIRTLQKRARLTLTQPVTTAYLHVELRDTTITKQYESLAGCFV